MATNKTKTKKTETTKTTKTAAGKAAPKKAPSKAPKKAPAKAPKKSAKRTRKAEAPLIVRGRPTHDEIARRAYQIWEHRGYLHGHDVQDWTTAELQLMKEP